MRAAFPSAFSLLRSAFSLLSLLPPSPAPRSPLYVSFIDRLPPPGDGAVATGWRSRTWALFQAAVQAGPTRVNCRRSTFVNATSTNPRRGGKSGAAGRAAPARVPQAMGSTCAAWGLRRPHPLPLLRGDRARRQPGRQARGLPREVTTLTPRPHHVAKPPCGMDRWRVISQGPPTPGASVNRARPPGGARGGNLCSRPFSSPSASSPRASAPPR